MYSQKFVYVFEFGLLALYSVTIWTGNTGIIVRVIGGQDKKPVPAVLAAGAGRVAIFFIFFISLPFLMSCLLGDG